MSRDIALVFVRRENRGVREVLLGEKLRGFGRGRVVGPGGKVDEGETPRQAAARELREETGLVVPETTLHSAGALTFVFAESPEVPLRAFVFTVSWRHDEPVDSDEISVRWVPEAEIPYDRMWADARHWLPSALAGGAGDRTFSYGPDGVTLVDES